MSDNAYEELPIHDEMIRLGQALKLANLAEDGHVAKTLVAEGRVTVNGAVETRRGAQLHPGDVVAVEGSGLPGVHLVSA
ncbi:RNA-binding S4 domain-containing protein [Kocuria tytonis]|uniref:RNA-binding S4 domain-containing protein n=1 Tax=Kocuria tytonis TaxID=2054280 RepID=A0A495A1V7_9MICC|nr:RNA-binding S4 domain-containing protein [Kocuria tytonis]RKQ33402.1 RNA-binding S4 domain-containing protein [Kocuria tytonis]